MKHVNRDKYKRSLASSHELVVSTQGIVSSLPNATNMHLISARGLHAKILKDAVLEQRHVRPSKRVLT